MFIKCICLSVDMATDTGDKTSTVCVYARQETIKVKMAAEMEAHMTRVQNRQETPTPRKASDTTENQVHHEDNP